MSNVDIIFFFAHTVLVKEVRQMEEKNVNTCIGCGVTECKYNHTGDYCTLPEIHVGNTCSCEEDSCTCCDSFSRK